MRVGIVCPYSFDVPGGGQGHVIDLTKALLARGHQVSVLAPADEDAELPEFVHPAGKALGIPYNGSVAPLPFGPASPAPWAGRAAEARLGRAGGVPAVEGGGGLRGAAPTRPGGAEPVPAGTAHRRRPD